MIGETSKLTPIIPPNANEKRILGQSRYNSYRLVGRTSHEFISITEIFGDSLVPCNLLMFSPVFPKCSNAQYKEQERNSDPALLFHRRLTCMTQRSGCLYCGSSRY